MLIIAVLRLGVPPMLAMAQFTETLSPLVSLGLLCPMQPQGRGGGVGHNRPHEMQKSCLYPQNSKVILRTASANPHPLCTPYFGPTRGCFVHQVLAKVKCALSYCMAFVFRGWKAQKVGVCGWTRCPLNGCFDKSSAGPCASRTARGHT